MKIFLFCFAGACPQIDFVPTKRNRPPPELAAVNYLLEQCAWSVDTPLPSPCIALLPLFFSLQQPLFRNKRFALNKMFQRNASKFARYILCIRKPMKFFSFFILCNFTFLLYECPGLCPHTPGHS